MDGLEMIRRFSDELPKNPKHGDYYFLHGNMFAYCDELGWVWVW